MKTDIERLREERKKIEEDLRLQREVLKEEKEYNLLAREVHKMKYPLLYQIKDALIKFCVVTGNIIVKIFDGLGNVMKKLLTPKPVPQGYVSIQTMNTSPKNKKKNKQMPQPPKKSMSQALSDFSEKSGRLVGD